MGSCKPMYLKVVLKNDVNDDIGCFERNSAGGKVVTSEVLE